MLRLRQIALVARDRDAVVADLVAVLGLRVGYEDPHIGRLGLHNALLPVGTQLLEVVAPIVEGTTAERYLERRGGDGGYMVITQTDGHAARRARVDELGIRIVGQFDDAGFTNMQLHPRDTGGSFLEIDEQAGGEDPYGPWSPAGPDWQQAISTDVVSAITAAEIQCDDPDAVSARWTEIVEIDRARIDGAPIDRALQRVAAVRARHRRSRRGSRRHRPGHRRRRAGAPGGRRARPARPRRSRHRRRHPPLPPVGQHRRSRAA